MRLGGIPPSSCRELHSSTQPYSDLMHYFHTNILFEDLARLLLFIEYIGLDISTMPRLMNRYLHQLLYKNVSSTLISNPISNNNMLWNDGFSTVTSSSYSKNHHHQSLIYHILLPYVVERYMLGQHTQSNCDDNWHYLYWW
jgi:hypothetical protein